MRKLSILVQWLVLLGVIGFAAFMLLRPPPEPAYQPEAWRSWEGVTVLSYAGIARRDEPLYPSTARLNEHLQALRGAGYQTVRPEDVRAFLAGHKPLPDKALLLIFEGGRKEAFIRATPLLQQNGFMAVLAIPTATTRTWDGFFLSESAIRRAARLPQWHIGSMGHEGFRDIPVNPDGDTGRFLTQRLWTNGRQEDSAAFQTRVWNDYTRSAAILQSAAGRPPAVYLYPFADAGQSTSADALAETVNRAGLERHYPLAFVGGQEPFNGPGSDPLALSRLRVPGIWSAEQLLAELRLSRPRRQGMPSLGAPANWNLERDAAFPNDSLALPPAAAAWLRGSDGWDDIEIQATLGLTPGATASLYARYAGPRSWLRIALTDEGWRLQEQLPARLQTLHRQAWPDSAAPAEVRVRLRLRNNRAWVWIDDREAAANLPLAALTRRGRVGFGAQDQPTRITAFQAQLLPARLALANSIRLIPEDQRPALRAVLPVWFRAADPPQAAETHWQDLLQAAIAGIETIPVIAGADTLPPEEAAAFAETVDAIIQDHAMKALVRTFALDGPAEALATAFRTRGYRLVHLLAPDQAGRRAPAIARLAPEDIVLVNEPGAAARAVLADLLHVMPADRLAALEEPDPAADSAVRTALFAARFPDKED